MTSKATDADNVRKFEEMFERRLAKGTDRITSPILAVWEFAADVSIAEPALSSATRLGCGGSSAGNAAV